MHWSFIVCMIYLWRTRVTPISHYVKSCANCKFFMPPTDDISTPYNLRLGRCMVYPQPDKKVADLVVGTLDPNYTNQFRYAIFARMNENMCGFGATNFSPKIPFHKWRPNIPPKEQK